MTVSGLTIEECANGSRIWISGDIVSLAWLWKRNERIL